MGDPICLARCTPALTSRPPHHATELIDGKAIAEEIRRELKAEVDELQQKYGKVGGAPQAGHDLTAHHSSTGPGVAVEPNMMHDFDDAGLGPGMLGRSAARFQHSWAALACRWERCGVVQHSSDRMRACAAA